MGHSHGCRHLQISGHHSPALAFTATACGLQTPPNFRPPFPYRQMFGTIAEVADTSKFQATIPSGGGFLRARGGCRHLQISGHHSPIAQFSRGTQGCRHLQISGHHSPPGVLFELIDGCRHLQISGHHSRRCGRCCIWRRCRHLQISGHHSLLSKRNAVPSGCRHLQISGHHSPLSYMALNIGIFARIDGLKFGASSRIPGLRDRFFARTGFYTRPIALSGDWPLHLR